MRGATFPRPLFLIKNEEITEGRKGDRASKQNPDPLGKGLDRPLAIDWFDFIF